jgi:antitoxin (DNA-binding transcriptional repressor) of toxin-antitoxin stability system
MKIVSATDFVRQARKVFDQVSSERESVTIERNGRPVVHVVPAIREMTAREAFGDLYGMLDPRAGKSWLKDARVRAKEGIADPWAS